MSPSSSVLTGAEFGELALWDLGRPAAEFGELGRPTDRGQRSEATIARRFCGHSDIVTCVYFDEVKVVSAGWDLTVRSPSLPPLPSLRPPCLPIRRPLQPHYLSSQRCRLLALGPAARRPLAAFLPAPPPAPPPSRQPQPRPRPATASLRKC